MSDAADVILEDIPRHLTAIAEWGACMVYILIIGRRAGYLISGGACLAGLAALLLVQSWAGQLPLALWIPGMLLAAAAMYLLVFTTLRVSAVSAGYLAARAFVLAELAASVYWQLDRFYADHIQHVSRTLLCVLVYAIVFGIAWWIERAHFPPHERFEVGWTELISALAIAGATFAISNLSFISANTPFSSRFGPEILYIRTLVDFAGYVALHAQHRARRELHARRDAEAMATLLRTQHDQYEITQRSIEEVNRKYHDMKHHLDALRAEQDAGSRGRMVDELEESIRGYGAAVHTGNQVLDAVLTAKRGYARDHDIEVSSVADGRLLDFLSPLDLTAIVGNAMDNAIEAASHVADADARTVQLALFAQDDFVMLRVENTYDGVLRREAGRLLTRKSDGGHGYGLRSIETAAEAYGGSISIAADGAWFSLRVLFPRDADRQP